MIRRHELTDEEWDRLEPLLPPQKPKVGRPGGDLRRIVNGILWIDRTGAPWRDLPDRYGPVGTVSSRFYRWRQAGVWDRVLAALQQQADQAGALDWNTHYVDGSVIRAHQHAAGAKKGTRRLTRRSGAAKGASAPNSTSALRATESP
jgi:transposase